MDNDLRRPAEGAGGEPARSARKGSEREKRANFGSRFAKFNDFVLNAGKVAINRVR